MDLFKDLLGIIIGVLYAAFELLSGFRRMSRRKRIILLIVTGLLIYLGVDQHSRKNETDRKNSQQMNSLTTGMKNLQEAKTRDSIKAKNDSAENAVFQKRLFDEFKIIRDSVTNQPRQHNYNTTIDRVENLHIGPN